MCFYDIVFGNEKYKWKIVGVQNHFREHRILPPLTACNDFHTLFLRGIFRVSDCVIPSYSLRGEAIPQLGPFTPTAFWDESEHSMNCINKNQCQWFIKKFISHFTVQRPGTNTSIA